MKKFVIEKKRKVIELIEHTHKGVLEKKGGKNIAEEFESQMLGILNSVTSKTGEIALKSLNSSNRMLNMIRSGSKGSDINMGQMIACVGQQVVDGKRIPLGFSNRTLPHFHKFDDGASARGFVENSFMNGLTPTEFFFHAMGGREGLIDTAVKTSETGYIQRKLIKGLEDARIVADNTVRNANSTIIQFIYGEDGFDATKIEKQLFSSIGKSNKEIFKLYYLSLDELKHCITDSIYQSILTKKIDYEEKITKFVENIIKDRDFYFEHFFKGTLDNNVYYPVNFKRLITNTSKNFNNLNVSDLDPLYVIDKIENLSKELIISENYNSSTLITVLARIYLSPKIVCYKEKLTKFAFDYIITSIKAQFNESIAVNGELVGTIAAQSIGEPSTQMTLNTFHFAGVASKSSVNQGVPRFKELLSVTENLKAPMNNVILKEPYCYNKESALKILNEFPITTIKEITISTEIFFDLVASEELESHDTVHNDYLKMYKEFENFDKDISESDSNFKRSPWVLKIQFNKSKMMNKEIQMSDIYFAISNRFNNESYDISCFYTDDNSSDLIMRIQANIKKDTKDENDDCDEEDVISVLKQVEKTILNDIILSGIKNITGASMEPNENFMVFNNDTGEYNKQTMWEIYTDGSNLEDILIHPAVNSYETTTNNIWQIYEVLGIEAARKMLYAEINNVFEMSGAYVNSRHISLLVDIMTNRGYLMPMDRHGINKSDRGPLSKCSFEETPDIIARAAIFGEIDKIQSVSANIMLGQEVPIGTGCIDILFDEDKYYDTLSRDIEISDDSDLPEQSELHMTGENKYTQDYCDNLF